MSEISIEFSLYYSDGQNMEASIIYNNTTVTFFSSLLILLIKNNKVKTNRGTFIQNYSKIHTNYSSSIKTTAERVKRLQVFFEVTP